MKQGLILAILPALLLAQNVPFSIIIRPDNFPGDISWELFFRANNQLIGRGTTSAAGNLPVAEYLFRISDSFGDGICCANGQGSYDLRANNVNFFTSDGQYGGEEVVEFSLNTDLTGTIVNGAEPTTPVANGDFDITLVADPNFDPTGLESVVAALNAAAARWEEVIVGDLPDINGVDDLRIVYDFSPIDGRGGTIGQAGPRRIRSGSLLPYEGVMTFDSEDIGRLTQGQQEALFLHEMGHVLGIGTLWRNLGCSQCESGIPEYNPTGQCPAAAAAFEDSPGRSPGAQLLIEQDGGGGTACGHFDEEQLQTEVMTGFLTVNSAGVSELSTITIGTLQDMGYTVNFDAADSFSIPISSLNSEILMDLTGDMDDTEMEVDTVDSEMGMEMLDLNEMMESSNTGLYAGIGAAAGVVALAGVALVIKRRRSATAPQKLVEEKYGEI